MTELQQKIEEVGVDLELEINNKLYFIESTASVTRYTPEQISIKDVEFSAWDHNGNFLDQKSLKIEKYNEIIDKISQNILLVVYKNKSSVAH